MAADLDAGQVAYLHSELGSAPDDTALQARWDRLGHLSYILLEELRTRRADMISGPLVYQVHYQINEDGRESLRALDEQIVRIERSAGHIDAGDYFFVPEQIISQHFERHGRSRWRDRGYPRAAPGGLL